MKADLETQTPKADQRRCPVAIIWLGLCLLGLGGCEDEITNEIESTGGSIYGRVTPAEEGTEVAAWQATEIKAVTIDGEGFFTISDLEDGLYNVVVDAPSGAHHEIGDVSVDHDHSVSLGVIELIALPPPLLGFNPSDGDSNVSTEGVIRLIAREPLAMASLNGAVEIEPATSGSWEPSFGGPAYNYYFRPQTRLQTSTEYRIHINETLRSLSGEAWGASLDFAFRTEPLSLQQAYWERPGEVSPLHDGRLVVLEFNADLDPASISGAIRTNPSSVLTAAQTTYSRRNIEVEAHEGFIPGTQYQLLIDETLRDSGGHPVGSPESLAFVVEAFRIIAVEIRGENGEIAPGGELFASIRLNARVDQDAFNEATAFNPEISGVWLLQTYDPGVYFEFFPTGPLDLRPGQTYTLRVDGSAPLADGVALGADYVTQFTVQPVRVQSLNPANGQRGVPPYASIGVIFNTRMNQAATEAAFTLRILDGAAVSGSFSWYEDGRTFNFSPNGNLQTQTAYEISISTAAQSQSGEELGSAVSSLFRTQ